MCVCVCICIMICTYGLRPRSRRELWLYCTDLSQC